MDENQTAQIPQREPSRASEVGEDIREAHRKAGCEVSTAKLSHVQLWNGRYRGVGFKISLHGVGENSYMDGMGTWCFYVYIHEDAATNFPALWLEDTIHRYKPEAKGRITHDYYTVTSGMELHGGCTFYQKHGHTEGFRCVEIGCDYAHIWDRERGYDYTVEDILRDVQKCIDSLYENRFLKPEEAAS